jgi:hypothetical protein
MSVHSSKYRNQTDNADDAYKLATKGLVIKTLIALGVIMCVVIIAGIYFVSQVYSKKTATKPTAEPAVLEDTTQKAAETQTPVPSSTATPTPSPSSSSSPSVSPSTSPTPTPKPSTTPTPTPAQTPSPTPAATQGGQTIGGQKGLDGYQSNNGTGASGSEIKIGKSNTAITRGFISFDITSLKGKNINTATVRIFQNSILGNPYQAGGDIKLDHVNFGDTFDNADYSVSSLAASFVTISTNANKEWKEATVTERIKDDLANNRKHSQFRLHFATENMGNLQGEYALFESAENSLQTGNTPQLVIK